MTSRQMLLCSAAAAMLGAVPLAARAQPVNGLYIAGAAGVNGKESQSFSYPNNCIDGLANIGCDRLGAINVGAANVGGTIRGHANYDVGFGLLGSVGYGFGNGLRAEIEGNYRNNSVSNVQVNGFGNVQTQGTAHTYGVMTNLLFDMNINQSWIFPYIGAGVGYAWTNLDNIHPSNSSQVVVNGTDGNFAYQAMLGAAFPIASVPGLSLTAEYRFMGVAGSTHYPVRLAGFNANHVSVGDQYNHAGMFGLRYAFGAPPAPMPIQAAAPIAPPTRSFMVFFDWDKYNLSERARGVIRDAANTSKSVQHTTIEVNGYADTSGSPGYNKPLSMKRAQAVAAELVRDGVARNEIAIQAFGDTVLLVPTGPGVREPQNRRVEIIIK